MEFYQINAILSWIYFNVLICAYAFLDGYVGRVPFWKKTLKKGLRMDLFEMIGGITEIFMPMTSSPTSVLPFSTLPSPFSSIRDRTLVPNT